MWRWQPDPDTGYTVRGVYQLLTTRDSVTYEVKPDHSRHLIFFSTVACSWLWGGRVG
ncbi:hypothetical protein L195_g013746 [Trifolium pratense]|uniref:Uncharacterized protein n=1 Tax=Trifolium pratense TaxID=57577 RepID=A0A2K3PNZ1_TRIPR|nr:hypothetical protein L195_g013746 [Trifolium pratense]